MKKKALNKDFRVELRKSFARFLSLTLIVALGVAFFAGIRSTKPDMELSADQLYDERNFMDVRILGTLGLTEEDVEAVLHTKEVKQAEGAYSKDVLLKSGDKQMVTKVMSLPEQINRISIKEGRQPQNKEECIVDVVFLMNSNYKIGDTITIQPGEEEKLEDSFEGDSYTIVGSCTTPYYLSMTRGNASIGNGKVDYFIMVPKEAFAMDYFTEIYAVVEGADRLLCYSDQYKDVVDAAVEHIEEQVAPAREQARYDEIMDKAVDELDKAKDELADGEEKANKELAKAEKELKKAKQQIEDGKSEIEENEKKLKDARKEYEDGTKELEDAKQQIAEMESVLAAQEAELKKAVQQYKEGETEYKEKKKELDQGEAALKTAKAEISEAEKAWEAGKKEIEEAEAGIDAKAEAGLITDQEAEAMKSSLEQKKQELAASEEELFKAKEEYNTKKDALDQAKLKLKSAKTVLDSSQKQIQTGERQLQEGKDKLSQGKSEIAQNQEKLNDAKIEIEDGEEKLKEAKSELKEAKKKYTEGKADYEEALEELEEELAHGRKKIEDAQEEITKIKHPEWYVLDRDSIQTYVEYSQDSDRIGKIGDVFPIIFFLVAALVSLTTMTRMVEEQRTLIGTYKALGYGKVAIALKYIKYALAATLLGSVLGGAAGCSVLPAVIITAYRILYQHLEVIKTPVNYGYISLAAGISLACVLSATAAACFKELHSSPADLMRPEAPKQGKRVLLERVPLIWKHLSFTWKATIRNLFRYKKRLFMTIIGIGGCMALMLVGFGLKDSIFSIASLQYDEVQVYDMVLELKEDMSEQEQQELQSVLNKEERIKEFAFQYHKSYDAGNGSKEKQAYVTVMEDPKVMDDFVKFRDRKTKKEFHLSENGLVLTEKLAKLLGVKTGDTIYLNDGNQNRAEGTIDFVAENYVYHNIYMASSLYEKMYGVQPVFNEIVVNGSDLSREEEEQLASDLLALDGISSLSLTRTIQERFEDIIDSLNIVILVLIISAGGLAFVVLFNLNHISINERKRELATLKVLGFFDLEVSEYVYRENVLLTMIGIALGMGLGVFLHRYVIITCEIDMIMFGRNINLPSFVYSALLTGVFAFLINVTMHFKLKLIDMATSLKSVE